MSFKIRDNDNKTYLVFGVPHSATSLVARGLEKMGIKMRISNDEFYESNVINKINNKILKDAGGKWYRPPTKKRIGSIDEYNGDIKKVIGESKGKFWGIKDPRLSLTAKKWLPFLKDDAYLICCFRKPDRIKKSWKESVYPINKDVIDKYNKSIIGIIKEFCGL